MTKPSHLRHGLFAAFGFVSLLLATCVGSSFGQTQLVAPGFRPIPPGVHALVGARVVIKPGQVLEKATIIIRDGFIRNVGADAVIPADARVWDVSGLTIYAGFIDPCLVLPPKTAAGAAPARVVGEAPGSFDDSETLTSGAGTKFFGVNPQERDAGDTTSTGYEVAKVTPERRMAQTFSPDPKALEKMREIGFTTANVVPEKGVIRGISAFVALSDVEPTRAIIKPEMFQHVSFEAEGRGRASAYPASLMGVIAVVRQSFFDTQHYILDEADYRNRPKNRARPDFNVGLAALAPASEKKMRVVFEPGSALMVDRATRVAHELNLDYYIVSSGQEWRRPELAKAAGVPFIVPLNFPTLPKLPQDDDWEQATLDELRAWDWAAENPLVLRNQGVEIALTTYKLANKSDFRKNLRLALDRGLAETDALAALTTVPAKLCGLDNLLGTVEPGKLANLTVVDGKGYFDAESKVRSVWIDGRYYRVPGAEEKEEVAAKADDKTQPGAKDDKAAADKKQADKEAKAAKLKELQKRIAHDPLDGRGVLTNPPAVLIKNATIWTSGAAGRLENGYLLVVKGKIAAVGPMSKLGTAMPAGTLVIDGTGMQVTPGLIDCHSHSMILGGGNEGTLPSSAMVRIGDVINSETRNIYDQLAGGLTMAHVLHGSANPIGGQNCLIKLRDGELPEGLKFEGAPGSIKFALGENVKQSNRPGGEGGRFPQTRMGVQTFYANRFTAARQYLKEIADAKSSGGLPPRRDLELEALGEVLQGKRMIHCHSYRQDEILMLIRLTESFGVKIGTFQHVLEGYKVADEIAKHGAGGSTFSDWWAYKIEAYDAIPQNGSLMRERGVVISFNSDSNDLARRLYSEAAKAVKYGGTPEEEALKFVTLNPAIQLGIDKRVGSLETGKDGDFAIWSKSPLDSTTTCLQTWIEGRKYFDAALDPARTAALVKERTDLVAKAKKLATLSGPAASGNGSGSEGASDNSFFQASLEHEYDGVDRHCLDDE